MCVSSESSLKLATCVAAPCQPQLGARFVSMWMTLRERQLLIILRAFPCTCLLCPGCGSVWEDYTEECSQAHLKKKKKGGGQRPCAKSSLMLTIHKEINTKTIWSIFQNWHQWKLMIHCKLQLENHNPAYVSSMVESILWLSNQPPQGWFFTVCPMQITLTEYAKVYLMVLSAPHKWNLC